MVAESGALAVNQAAFFDNAVPDFQQSLPDFIAYDVFDSGNYSLTGSTPPATGGLSEFTAFAQNPYTSAAYSSQLGFATYPFNTRIHVAAPYTTMTSGSSLPLSAEILNDAVNPTSPVMPSGTLYIYAGSTLEATYTVPSACSSSNAGSCRIDGISVSLTGSGTVQDLVAVYSGDTNNGAGQSWPVPITVQ